MEPINLDIIRLDGGTQARAQLDDCVIRDYASCMKEGAQFPPVMVFHDGSDNWLADGFHRVHGAREAGLDSVLADIRQGTRRDAILYSVGANAGHGLRRKNGDLRRAVMVLLADPEWSQWSNCEIARRCACSESYVRSLREQPGELSSHSAKIRTVNRKGRTFQQDGSRIGQHKQATKGAAFQPVLGHSYPPPMVPLSLPRENPQLAADALIELFNVAWLTALAGRISNYIHQLPQGDSHD